MTLSAALLKHWVFGAFLCKLVNFMPTLTALVSTFTVAIISVERWSFIVNKQKFHRSCTIITLIFLWVVSILIALPEFISRQIQEFCPSSILPYMMSDYLLLSPTLNRTTDILETSVMKKSSCPMKKISYCVLKPSLSMRIFSYVVITVQYLVPFLFVSGSCYSISRFLKNRMKRMHTYKTSQHSTINLSKCSKSQLPAVRQDIVEQKFTSSNNTLSPSSITNTNHLFSCFHYCILQNSEHQYSLQPNSRQIDQSHSRRRFHRSRKLLICVAVLFTISWLPLTIVQVYLEHEEILYRYDRANFVYGFLLIPCYLISSLSSWLNPVIYNYINHSFRREFYVLYSCCFKVSSTTYVQELAAIVPKRTHQEMILLKN